MSQTIIAIDDEPYNLLLIENYLEGTGYDLKCFTSGIEALAFLRSIGAGAVDAILLDRMMPGMDGLTFMHELRTLEDHASVPVIVQTVSVSSAEIAEGIAAGAYYYLPALGARCHRHRGLDDFSFQRSEGGRTTDRGVGYAQCAVRTFDEVGLFHSSPRSPDQVRRLGITELMLNAIDMEILGSLCGEGDLIHQRMALGIERRLEM
jgi:CheY-like chemotaxis protein